ncbi:hypothetical protein MRB53_039471 [Persea americana]|nr:hypothetical protein MRB53_039471 [Persea americana]
MDKHSTNSRGGASRVWALRSPAKRCAQDHSCRDQAEAAQTMDTTAFLRLGSFSAHEESPQCPPTTVDRACRFPTHPSRKLKPVAFEDPIRQGLPMSFQDCQLRVRVSVPWTDKDALRLPSVPRQVRARDIFIHPNANNNIHAADRALAWKSYVTVLANLSFGPGKHWQPMATDEAASHDDMRWPVMAAYSSLSTAHMHAACRLVERRRDSAMHPSRRLLTTAKELVMSKQRGASGEDQVRSGMREVWADPFPCCSAPYTFRNRLQATFFPRWRTYYRGPRQPRSVNFGSQSGSATARFAPKS